MLKIYNVSEARQTILRRQAWDEIPVPESLLARLETLFGERISPEEATRRIVQDVRRRGDLALQDWARALDGSEPLAIHVPPEAITEAYRQVPAEVVEALRLAAERIEAFHRRQPALSWIMNTPEGTLGQLIRPIERVGIYAPGGSAPLPSSVLMSAIPARVAGVSFLAIISPPQRETGLPHPSILVAADLVKADAVYAAGGAQAIAALAFGTESVQRVDKICGPGGLFTTLAKRQVYGMVGIDGLPGPTETLVIADEQADARYVAADLLAQAEHDVLASAILLTPSPRLAEQVVKEAGRQIERLTRQEILRESLARRSGIVLTSGLDEAFDLANEYAPEHLCLLVAEPWKWVGRVQNAGGVFLGERSFEVLGDYIAGPSHTMPTGGTARFASPLNVWDFVKIISLVDVNESGLQAIGPAAEVIAQAEGLTAHAAAVRVRLEQAREERLERAQ